MYNEAILKKFEIPYRDYRILSNDNIYAVSFNPLIKRHDNSFFEYKAFKIPQTNEQTNENIK